MSRPVVLQQNQKNGAFSFITLGSRIPVVWAILLCPNYHLLPFLLPVRILLPMLHGECMEAHEASANLVCDLGAGATCAQAKERLRIPRWILVACYPTPSHLGLFVSAGSIISPRSHWWSPGLPLQVSATLWCCCVTDGLWGDCCSRALLPLNPAENSCLPTAGWVPGDG